MRTRKSAYIAFTCIVACLIAMVCTSCKISVKKHEPNEKTVTKQIVVPNGFQSINLSVMADLYFTVSDTFSVRVEGTETELEDLDVKVNAGSLDIWPYDHSEDNIMHLDFTEHKGVKVYVSAPTIKHVYLYGSGSFVCNDTIKNDESFDLTLNGYSNTKLTAVKSPSVDVSISGSGDIRIDNIYAVNTKYTIFGSGNINCTEIGSMSSMLEADGSGNINLDYNNCGSVVAKLTGSGDINVSGKVNSFAKEIIGSGIIYQENLEIKEK